MDYHSMEMMGRIFLLPLIHFNIIDPVKFLRLYTLNTTIMERLGTFLGRYTHIITPYARRLHSTSRAAIIHVKNGATTS